MQRLEILELLNELMRLHRDGLKELGEMIITGIRDLVSGEKDPRNLMVVFSILKVVMVEWDISGHAEVCIHHCIFQLRDTDYPSQCLTLCIATSRSRFVRPRRILMASLHKTSRTDSGAVLQHPESLPPMLSRS